MKKYAFIIPVLFFALTLNAGEYIYGTMNDYNRYLDLTGVSVSPSLGFHSYSENERDLPEIGQPWSALKEKETLFSLNGFNLMAADTRVFTSWNSAFARTMLNDGALWQGKGLNSTLQTGFEIENSWLRVAFLPELIYSQNQSFDTVPPAITSNQTSEYSYFYGGVDAPLMMGDEAAYDYSWGQSEIRADYGPLTLALSNENMVWGPAIYNPLIMSANGEGFLHLDFGLKKTETRFGDVEARVVYGQLKESDFFNENEDDDDTLFSGYSLSWSPIWFPFFTVGLNRSLIINWEQINNSALLKLYNPLISSNEYAFDETDQRVSFWLDWKIVESGTNFYLELFKEDHNRQFTSFLMYPEHTLGFTFGGEQVLPVDENRGFQFNAEVTWLQVSRTYDLKDRSGGTYYIHGIVYHGYTNGGQWLGSPSGPGADAQNVSLTWYDTWGMIKLSGNRTNKNKDYVYQNDLVTYNQDVEMTGGIDCLYIINENFTVDAGIAYTYNFNRNYIYKDNVDNFYLSAGMTYRY